MVDTTTNFKLIKVALDKIPWHEDINGNFSIIDALMARYISVTNVQGIWINAQAVTVGQRWVDPDTETIYEVLVAHTTASTGTFTVDRAANTANWQGVTIDQAFKGAWTAGTTYSINDFVVDGARYGVVAVAHTSVTSYDTGVTAGDIITLVNLSAYDVPSSTTALYFLRRNAANDAYELISAAAVLSAIGAGTGDGDLLAANDLSDLDNAATAFGNIKQAATAAATGVVELATDAEAITGTSTTRAMTPANARAALVDGNDKVLGKFNLKDYGEITNALGDLGGGTDDIDLTLGNVVTALVSTGTETFTFSNPTASDEGCSFTLILTNGGSQTVNWPGSVDWGTPGAPTLTTSGKDALVFVTTDGGSTWLGFTSGQGFA